MAQPTRVVPDSDPVIKALMSGGPINEVLVVDRTHELHRTVQNVLRSVATVHGCETFEDARRRLISSPPDLLVTSVRLDYHNGLHLVCLAARNPRTRSIVHLTAEDFGLASEAEALGAFVIREPWLSVAIEALVLATLRRSDRREPSTVDQPRNH